MASMIIIDTGFWLALRNSKDKFHAKAVECVERYSRERYITTWPVLTETYYLLLTKMGSGDAIAFLETYRQQAFDVFNLVPAHTGRILMLCDKYRDLPMDLADASLVVLAEHLGHGKIFSTDARDFNAYRWKQRKPFKNLMLETRMVTSQ